MQERTTVRLPRDLLARAKRKAAAEGRTLTSLIEDGLRRILDAKPNPKAKRILPRVSVATGGLLPGVDPIKFSEEEDDIEYARRLMKGFK
jgi:hypothetical protein